MVRINPVMAEFSGVIKRLESGMCNSEYVPDSKFFGESVIITTVRLNGHYNCRVITLEELKAFLATG